LCTVPVNYGEEYWNRVEVTILTMSCRLDLWTPRSGVMAKNPDTVPLCSSGFYIKGQRKEETEGERECHLNRSDTLTRQFEAADQLVRETGSSVPPYPSSSRSRCSWPVRETGVRPEEKAVWTEGKLERGIVLFTKEEHSGQWTVEQRNGTERV